MSLFCVVGVLKLPDVGVPLTVILLVLERLLEPDSVLSDSKKNEGNICKNLRSLATSKLLTFCTRVSGSVCCAVAQFIALRLDVISQFLNQNFPGCDCDW
jgi:hypothetical protein